VNLSKRLDKAATLNVLLSFDVIQTDRKIDRHQFALEPTQRHIRAHL